MSSPGFYLAAAYFFEKQRRFKTQSNIYDRATSKIHDMEGPKYAYEETKYLNQNGKISFLNFRNWITLEYRKYHGQVGNHQNSFLRPT